MSISNLDSKEKGVSVISTSSSILPLESNRLHFVARGEPLPEYDGVSDEQIAGYDRDLMRDRTTLTSAEGRKLKRRIDWRLLPLLALMYTIKTMDAQNVRAHLVSTRLHNSIDSWGNGWYTLGSKCTHYG